MHESEPESPCVLCKKPIEAVRTVGSSSWFGFSRARRKEPSALRGRLEVARFVCWESLKGPRLDYQRSTMATVRATSKVSTSPLSVLLCPVIVAHTLALNRLFQFYPF